MRHHPAPTPPAQPDPSTDWPALRTRIEASLTRLAELCGTDRDQADAERRATARRLDAVGRKLAAAS